MTAQHQSRLRLRPGVRYNRDRMKALQAKVVKGHLVLDEPTDLPDGTVVELVPARGEGDEELSDQEWAALRPLLERSWESAVKRRGQPLEQTLRDLSSRR